MSDLSPNPTHCLHPSASSHPGLCCVVLCCVSPATRWVPERPGGAWLLGDPHLGDPRLAPEPGSFPLREPGSLVSRSLLLPRHRVKVTEEAMEPGVVIRKGK